MSVFRCTIREPTGQVVVQRVEADSQSQVVDILSAQGNLILSIIEEPRGLARRRGRSKRVRTEEIVLFVRQLATMVDAGLPLLQALQTLEEQADPGAYRDVMHALSDDVTRGQSFSEALANHPKVFDKLFVSMIRAGETGGFLAEILERLASHMEEAESLRRKVKSAMMYPIVVSTIAISITIFLIVKVIPVFEDMFKDFGGQLPLPTKVLLSVSRAMRAYGVLMIAAVVGLWFLFRWYNGTPAGRRAVDRTKFKVPVFGPLLQKIAIARFTSTLSALVESGVPIIRSLEIVSETSGNETINDVLRDAMRRTEKGEPIADALRISPYVPRMVAKMVEVGETTGRLDAMLKRVSDFYTDQVNAAVSAMTSLIEPMLIVFLGVVVGGIVLSMFLPIFEMTQIVS
jgi:type IV pilus assembly protein PilC